MSIKLFLLLMLTWSILWDIFLDFLSHRHDQKPLPPEVSSIYDAERYRSYLQIEHEYRVTSYIEQAFHLLLDILYLFSPFYRKIELLANGNVYLIVILTILVTELLSAPIDLAISYYETFVIEEKHGLNKFTRKEFFKDTLIEEGTSILSSLVLYSLLVWLCRLVGSRFIHVNIGYGTATLVVLCIVGILIFAALGLSSVQFLSLRLKYRFTDLPNGELRNKVLEMTKGCKKKIRKIRVYNESSKSVEKNAFLLKFLWYREFGIADNFLEENAQDELLAVLAHEVGHLRYKRKFLDHIGKIFSLILLGILVCLVANLHILQGLDLAVRQAFGLSATNYILTFLVIMHLLKPYLFAHKIYSNYLSRLHEYEADAYSVSLGYAEPLKRTFMKLSTDELMNVNPAPMIEFLNYDHPGMYRRIKAINEKECLRTKK